MYIILLAVTVIAASLVETAPTTHLPIFKFLAPRPAIKRDAIPFGSSIWSDFGGCTQTCVMNNFGQICSSALSPTDYSRCICQEHFDNENATASCVAIECASELKPTAQAFVAICVNAETPSSLTVQDWLNMAKTSPTPSSTTSSTSTTASVTTSTTTASGEKPSGDGLSQEAKVGLGTGIGVGIPAILTGVACAIWGPSWARRWKKWREKQRRQSGGTPSAQTSSQTALSPTTPMSQTTSMT